MTKKTDSEILESWRKTRARNLKAFRKRALSSGRRHVAVMLNMRASVALDEIRTTTGETASGVIHRLLLDRGQEPTFNDTDIDLEVVGEIKSRITPDKKKTLDLIKNLRQEHGLSHLQIADYLNRKSIATFGKGEKWSQGVIGKLLRKMDVS